MQNIMSCVFSPLWSQSLIDSVWTTFQILSALIIPSFHTLLCSKWNCLTIPFPDSRHTDVYPSSRPETVSRSWCRHHGEVLLTGLILVVYSTCFIIEPRTTCPGVALFTMSLALAHQTLLKKIPYSPVYSLILLWRFLFEVPSSTVTLAWDKMTKKN